MGTFLIIYAIGLIPAGMFFCIQEIKNKTRIPYYVGIIVLAFYPVTLIFWKHTLRMFKQYPQH